MKPLKILLITFILILLSACDGSPQTPTTITPALNFSPKLSMFEEGKVQIELGIINISNRRQSAIEDASIRMIVTTKEGKIHNQMTIQEIQAIDADEAIYPLIFEAVYEMGTYTLSMTGNGIESLSIDIEIRDIGGVRKLAAPSRFINPFTEFTIDLQD